MDKKWFKRVLAIGFILGLFGWFVVVLMVHLGDERPWIRQVDQTVELPFLVAQPGEKLVFLYFGYVGCLESCPVTLQALSEVKESYDQWSQGQQVGVGAGLINLRSEVDQAAVKDFVHFYHPSFSGYTFEPPQLRQVARSFDVYFGRSLLDDYTVDHSGSLYLVERVAGQWRLIRVYDRYPPQPEEILADLKQLAQSRVN